MKTTHIVMVAAVMLPLAACSTLETKGRVTAARMCQAHGGAYNSSAQTCTYKSATLQAAATCQAQGGVYNSEMQFCESIGRE
jgi:hypothetical protein